MAKDKKEKQEEIVEEKQEEIVEEKKPVKNYEGDLRGFESLENAQKYIDTPEFKKLDIGCRTEYQNWLKSILEEE